MKYQNLYLIMKVRLATDIMKVIAHFTLNLYNTYTRDLICTPKKLERKVHPLYGNANSVRQNFILNIAHFRIAFL